MSAGQHSYDVFPRASQIRFFQQMFTCLDPVSQSSSDEKLLPFQDQASPVFFWKLSLLDFFTLNYKYIVDGESEIEMRIFMKYFFQTELKVQEAGLVPKQAKQN